LQNQVVSTNSYLVTGLTANTTYYYRVRASTDPDADAQAYFDRVTTAGGTLSTTEKNAVNQLVLDMKSYGIWTPMKAIYPMVGASAAACAQNLKSSSFTGSFSSGWTYASTGVTTNGLSSYFDTTLNPSITFGSSYASFGVYWRNTFTAGQTNIIGCAADLNAQRFDLGYDAGVTVPFVATGNDSSDISSDTNNNGFIIATRQGTIINKLFRNNTLKVNGVRIFTAPPNLNFYFGARNTGGVPSYFSNNQNIAFGFIGDGLTDTQASNFYTAVQAFQTTLSRQV
jgi:hypothetical protein